MGALRNTAIESARDGIKNISETVGKWAGAGLAVAGAAAAEAVGHRPAPWIAVGAAYAGMKVGGMVGKAMDTGLNRLTAGSGAGPIAQAMADLSTVLQTLDEVSQGIAAVVDSVNKAQAHVQKFSKGQGSNLLNGAIRAYRQAPERLEEGVNEVGQGQDLVGKHLLKVATAGC